MIKEYASEAIVFSQPETIPVLPVLLLGALRCSCRPLPPSVEEITQENDTVGVQNFLHARIRAAHVIIGEFYGEWVEGPWSAGVGMRVYELGVCDEHESMRIRIFGLQIVRSVNATWGFTGVYPVLPVLPPTCIDAALEDTPFTPVQHYEPHHNEYSP